MGPGWGKLIFIQLFLLGSIDSRKITPKDTQKTWDLMEIKIPKHHWKFLQTYYDLGGLDIYNVQHSKDGKTKKITAAGSKDTQRALDKAKIKYEIVQTLAKAVKQDWEGHSRRSGLMKDEITFESNLLYDDIIKVLDKLKDKSTDYREISVVTIGKSQEKRDIKMVRIEHPRARNIMFFDAGIHAREWLSVMTAMYLITSLVKASETDSINRMNWYIVPVINPDGYVYSHQENKRMHRKNTDFSKCPGNCTCGVDINRNFGYKWGVDGLGLNPCSAIYRGTKPFSEPESQTLSQIMERHKNKIKLYITMHSYGCDFLYPWGYDEKNCTDYKDLIAAADVAASVMNKHKMKHRVCNYIVDNAGKLPGAGGADDYAKGSLKIKYVYTLEVQPGGHTGFEPEDAQIRPFVAQNYAGLKAIAEYVNNKYAPANTEGHRKDAGDKEEYRRAHKKRNCSCIVRMTFKMMCLISAIALFSM